MLEDLGEYIPPVGSDTRPGQRKKHIDPEGAYMSVLGVVLIYRCDGDACGKHIAVHSEADLEKFGREWFVGGEADFCPRCRNVIANQARIAELESAAGIEWKAPLERLRKRFIARRKIQNAA